MLTSCRSRLTSAGASISALASSSDALPGAADLFRPGLSAQRR